jgi:hypothetical protein
MSRDQNRALMSKVTEFIDAVRAEFGECKVSFVSEGGITKGVKWPDQLRDKPRPSDLVA